MKNLFENKERKSNASNTSSKTSNKSNKDIEKKLDAYNYLNTSSMNIF